MGRYRRIKVVGKGSFGSCWLVEVGGEQCILKAIDISRMPAKQRDEAVNEVKVLAKLRHPFIINYRESYVEDGALCLITDYAEGGDLYRRIHAQKGQLFPEPVVLRWLTQISLALKHMHDRRVLHRDLKTQNVFLCGGGHGSIKLGDFGISCVLQHTQDCARTAIGTPYYLSPEICQERPYDFKSDVWSLGCVLYEMATLQHAFDSDSMRGLIIKILRGLTPQIPGAFSAELRALVPDMLTKDPKRRPSINQLLRRAVIKGQIELLLREESVLELRRLRAQRPSRRGAQERAEKPELRDETPLIATLKEGLREAQEGREVQDAVPERGGPVPECVGAVPERGGAGSLVFRAPDGRPVELAVGAADSRSYRIEALKVYLEQELGLDDFLFVYRYLKRASGQERCSSRTPLEAAVAPKAIAFLPLVHQLLVCEDAEFS